LSASHCSVVSTQRLPSSPISTRVSLILTTGQHEPAFQSAANSIRSIFLLSSKSYPHTRMAQGQLLLLQQDAPVQSSTPPHLPEPSQPAWCCEPQTDSPEPQWAPPKACIVPAAAKVRIATTATTTTRILSIRDIFSPRWLHSMVQLSSSQTNSKHQPRDPAFLIVFSASPNRSPIQDQAWLGMLESFCRG